MSVKVVIESYYGTICFEQKKMYFDMFNQFSPMNRPHTCHRYHRLYPWRKICHVEKFQISVKNLNNLWSFIKIYAVFVLNLCGEKSVWRKSMWRKNDKYEMWANNAQIYMSVHKLQTLKYCCLSPTRTINVGHPFLNASSQVPSGESRVCDNGTFVSSSHWTLHAV